MAFGRSRLTALVVLTRSAVLCAFLLLVAGRAFAGNVALAWDPVTDPAVIGYMVHHGPAAGSYTTSIDVGNTTGYTVGSLTEGATYHFAVTAYNAARTQSGYSNDVVGIVPYSKPVADFTASTTSGAAPLAMNFVNSSTGVISTYAWTFGDGGTSTLANPTHVYSAAGVYTVGLTVTGPGGSSTKTRANFITVSGSSDTSPPTTPSSLTATASGSGTINLAWTAATDNVGVTGYRVYRCQGASCTNYGHIATSTGTTFSNTGLTAATTYRYQVRANDAAGNLSGYSPIATATTAAAGDTSPPTTPSSLTATANGSGTINLAWTASTDNVGVTGYRVERCDGTTCTTYAQIATPTGTTFSDTGLTAATTHRYRVRANDAAGNVSGYSPVATATTAAATDTSPPTAPSSLTATASGTGTINLAWTAGTDNVGVTGYRVYRCQGASCTAYLHVASSTGTATTLSNTSLTAATTYRYRVRARDAAGNLSGNSPSAAATTTGAADTSPPTPPSNLTATATVPGTINLAWTAATDNLGVTGYRVERCPGSACTSFAEVGIAPGTTYANGGLLAGTTYRYRVRAADAAGNLGGYSNITTSTTTAAAAPISFIQVSYAVPQTPQATVSVTFPQAQTAGNLNVVVVGWNDSVASVTSVTDSKGNVYTRAVGPTILSGTLSQSIYYAKSIAAATAGANTLTVRFNVPAVYPDIRVLEYGGLDKVNPVDATATGSGAGTLSSTTSVATTSPRVLLFGANTVTGWTLGAGTGFTSRTITSPNGDIAEDRVVTSTGSYSATASLNGGSWVMQMVAFKAAP